MQLKNNTYTVDKKIYRRNIRGYIKLRHKNTYEIGDSETMKIKNSISYGANQNILSFVGYGRR